MSMRLGFTAAILAGALGSSFLCAGTVNLHFTPGAISFGVQDVADGRSAVRTLRLENVGSETVYFNSYYPINISNGEFLFTTPADTTPLAPGESRSWQLAFDPHSAGERTGNLTVYLTSPTSTTVIGLSGTGVYREIVYGPSPIDFGVVDIDGPPVTRNETVYNAGTNYLRFGDPAFTLGSYPPSALTISDLPLLSPIASRETRTATLRYAPTRQETTYTIGSLTIRSNDPDEATVTVPIRAAAGYREVDVSPTALDFGDWNIDAGPSPARRLTVRNAGWAELAFPGTGVSPGWNFAENFGVDFDTAQATLPGLNNRYLDLVFDPSAIGERTSSLKVLTNDRDEPYVTVSVRGRGISPQVALLPTFIDGGSVQVDKTSRPVTVIIANGGIGPLTFDAQPIAFTGGAHREFAVLTDTGETSIEQGETRTIQIVFTPRLRGLRTALLNVRTNDWDTRVAVGALSGMGVSDRIEGPTGFITPEIVNALLGYFVLPVPLGDWDVNHDGRLDASDVVANVQGGGK